MANPDVGDFFTPKDIIERLKKSGKLINRLNSLEDIFNDFLRVWNHTVILDRPLLVQTVKQYFCASEIMKLEKGITYTDPHKRAAYTIWAINKYRPIKYIGSPNKPKLLVNELFALHAGLGHIKIDVDDVSTPELEAILHLLHTHDVDPDWLAVLMYMFEQRSLLKAASEKEKKELMDRVKALEEKVDKLKRK